MRRKTVEQMHWEKARKIAAECRTRHRLTEEYWEEFLKSVPHYPNDENVKGFWNQAAQHVQEITKKLIPAPAQSSQNGGKNSRAAGGGGFFPAAARLPVFEFP